MELQKKLTNLQEILPMDLKKFVASVKLPKEEDCFEFSYFQTFINIINLFSEKGAKIMVYKNKSKIHYKNFMTQNLSLIDPDNEKNAYDVVIKMFSSGDGYHRFAEISYDEKSFFIDRTDGETLTTPILSA